MYIAFYSFGIVIPKTQASYIHSSVAIKCISLTPVKWSTDNRKKKLPTASDNVLYLNDLKESDAGYYTCHGTKDRDGQRFSAKAEVLVGGKFKSLYYIVSNGCSTSCDTIQNSKYCNSKSVTRELEEFPSIFKE